MSKFLEGDALRERREQLYDSWEFLREATRRQLFPLAELRKKLEAAHCPVLPAQIGLPAGQFLHGVAAAQLIRTRYTVLDAVYELGLLKVLLQFL